MSIVFFDDEFHQQLGPLTLTRPSADLRVGILTISEKWAKILEEDDIGYRTRAYLEDHFPSIQPKENDYFINGRLLPTDEIVDNVRSLENGQRLMFGSLILASKGISTNDSIEVSEAQMIDWSWDIFQHNVSQIQYDIELLGLKNLTHTKLDWDSVHISSPENVFAHPSAKVEPGVMLLADEGPIYLGEDSHIMAGSIIRGNNAFCDHSTVKMGAKFYEGSTIGPHCKVGGEVQNSVFHSYSNKGHDGYIGNSVIGQWCNLGAGTDTSNLKNNYSKIAVSQWGTGKRVNTGQQFIGTIMGDHSKIAIGTTLNTATQCGVFANVFSSGFPPKIIPSYSWMGDGEFEVFKLEKALEMAKNMMDRRSVPITLSYEKIIRHLFDESNT